MTASGTLVPGVGMAATQGWGQSQKGTVPVTQSHHHPSVPQEIRARGGEEEVHTGQG